MHRLTRVSPIALASVVLTLTLLPCGIAAAQSAAPSGPKLALDKTRLDFGTLWYGDPCELTLELSNAGDAPLELSEIKTSCGCTAAKLEKKLLAPGEKTRLTVNYDTKKGTKDVSQNITILTNETATREHHVAVTGTVHQVFDGDPTNTIVLGMIPFDSTVTRTLDLVCSLPEKVTLRVGTLPADFPVAVRLEPVSEGQRYKLHVTTKPPVKLGPVNVKVPLMTSSLKHPELLVPVNGRAVEAISVVPDQIGLSPRNDKPTRRMVMVNYPPDRPVRVTGLVSDFDGIKVEMGPLATAPPHSEFDQQQIYVNLPAFADIPEAGAKITIYTDAPDAKFQQLEVTVYRIGTRAPHGG